MKICSTCSDYDPGMLSGSGDCDSGSFFTTVDAFRSELGDGTSLAHPGLVCLDCKKCVAVKVMGGLNWVKPHPAWRTLDDLLNTGDLSKNGWIKAESDDLESWQYHSLLNHVCYFINTPPCKSKFECSYSDPDPRVDTLFLLYNQGEVAGFATLRQKGTKRGSLDCASDTFPMDVLDTVFITEPLRGQGFAKKLVLQILEGGSGLEDLGFSTPISTGMLIIALRTCSVRKDLRERLWLIEDQERLTETEGKSNLWWSGVKLARERQLDIKTMLRRKKIKKLMS